MLPVSVVVIPDARQVQDFIATSQKISVTLGHRVQSLTALSSTQDRVNVATLVVLRVQDCTATKQKISVTLIHHAQSLTALSLILIQDRVDVVISDATMPQV